MSAEALRKRIEAHIRRHNLVPPGGEVACLVSGGQDSTCLWHALGALGYRVAALHVNHGLRGEESEEDARHCRESMGAVVIRLSGSEPQSSGHASAGAEDVRLGGSEPQNRTEATLRDARYRATEGHGLRATGHTASDQVETVLYRLVSRGHATGIRPRRQDGVVRPLLPLWREETAAYCEAEGLTVRRDSSNPDTKRGLIRDEILPLLRRLHPAADENLLRAIEERRPLPPALAELLASRAGSKRVDLGGGLQAVREYDRLWLETGPVRLEGPVRWGDWRIESEEGGLVVRAWRAGDRLAGRKKKVQDVFVDAKVPRSEREGWPLVVRGDEVVAIPGLVDAPGVRAERA